MPHHVLLNKGRGSPTSVSSLGVERYSGEVYLNRRKIWEERFSTREEAFSAAKQKQEEVKHKGKTSIVVRPTV